MTLKKSLTAVFIHKKQGKNLMNKRLIKNMWHRFVSANKFPTKISPSIPKDPKIERKMMCPRCSRTAGDRGGSEIRKYP